jgi:hypothetical protein
VVFAGGFSSEIAKKYRFFIGSETAAGARKSSAPWKEMETADGQRIACLLFSSTSGLKPAQNSFGGASESSVVSTGLSVYSHGRGMAPANTLVKIVA